MPRRIAKLTWLISSLAALLASGQALSQEESAPPAADDAAAKEAQPAEEPGAISADPGATSAVEAESAPPPAEAAAQSEPAETGGGDAQLEKSIQFFPQPADEEPGPRNADVLTGQESREHLKITLPGGHVIPVKMLGVYELHFNVLSDDYSANDWFAYYLLQTYFDITKNNQLALRLDMEQKYVADEGEAGLYLGNLRFYYSRKFVIPIPGFEIPGKASVYVTAPTSRIKRQRSYVTEPTAVLKLVPAVWKLSLVSQGYFSYQIARFAESGEGEALNTMFVTGYDLQLVFQPLDWLGPYVWWKQGFEKYYPSREGKSQPWLSSYGFELGVDFTLPSPQTWAIFDVVLAYSQGANLLQDGVFRSYFGKRDQSNLYLGINITY